MKNTVKSQLVSGRLAVNYLTSIKNKFLFIHIICILFFIAALQITSKLSVVNQDTSVTSTAVGQISALSNSSREHPPVAYMEHSLAQIICQATKQVLIS